MLKLAVIADDFTGALDTGIKFAKSGARTQVMLRWDFSFSEIDDECTVLVVDTETRHLKPEEAYQVIYTLVKRCSAYGVETFYKKTDSALRGCVGSELAAIADATGRDVQFVPALPKENRTTRNGVQYIDGIPVARSIFGRDPFEPVRHSRIEEILREETDKRVIHVGRGERYCGMEDSNIVVYDASTDEDIRRIADDLVKNNKINVLAGCAGFASCIQGVWDFRAQKVKQPKRTRSLLVACGSINEITKKQLSYAQREGFTRISLDVHQKLQENYFQTPEAKKFLESFREACRKECPVILDTCSEHPMEETIRYAEEAGIRKEELRWRIAGRVGEFIERWLDFGLDDTVVITGGDTVYAFLMQINCTEIEPVCEAVPGVVLFHVKIGDRTLQVLSKSGGFGNESVFAEIASGFTYGGCYNEEKLS